MSPDSHSDGDVAFHVPSVGEDEVEAAARVLRSGWLTTGPETMKFEAEFAPYVGAKHAIACASGTAALHLALRALGVSAGDEVITSPYTFVASSEVILYTGATPVFVDVDPRTLNIDPAAVAAAVTPRTRAILPIHIAGYPCDMGPIMDVAAKHGLGVVEDAAHALPADYRGKRIGSIGTATAFSFYATKNLTTGEGGMVTTDDADIAARMRVLRLHGISGDAWKRYTQEGTWYYEVTDVGYKYNLTDIQAAIGRVQLAKLDALDAVRRRLDRRYREALADAPLVLPPDEDDEHRSALHIFIVRIDPERTSRTRDEVIAALRRDRIGTSVHFIPVHLHPYYQSLGFRKGMFPNAERGYEAAVTIPFYPAMSDATADRVLSSLRSALGV